MLRSHRRLSMFGYMIVGVVIGLTLSGRLAIIAQERIPPKAPSAPTRDTGDGVIRADKPAASIQDALLRPYTFSFAEPTTLSQVCARLKQSLNAPVVLDLAALGRLEIDGNATVQLELEGVRLKTGLKLLLDQVELTYQVVPEDNLLIITDKEGSTDPLDRVLSSLQALHRDLHDVQDALDEIVVVVGDEEAGPAVRKPTIIEEMPGPAVEKDEGGRSRGEKPLEKGGPQQGGGRTPRRSTPGKVPLGFRGR